ncbi:hypothetical protein [Paraliomyxa miuraensis]|uniref:hypothetical protein n=1 Tax=Paraliomyxa miuraensis TaxID=376150 RepID=UPI002251A12E|nr:hypothetical protein [Paraliomyxa miuraensis]MCX4244643.1 hypothetical protein [Paraliomyxa miuraensis]
MPPVTLALMLSLWAAPATASGPPPAAEPPPGPPATEAAPPTEAPSDDYVQQAPLDVETLLTDSSKAYLQARARLEDHPELAAEAILDRLATVPPPTSTDRKRLLDVLAVLGLPDHVELFAQELRRAVARAEDFQDESKALKQWLPLLVEQGAVAVPSLTALVADRELNLITRGTILEALVEATPSADVANLVPLVGRGARPLRQQLYRSLKRRAGRDAQAAAVLVAATDEALRQAETARVPALLALRGVLARDDDGFITTLATLAEDETTAFATRVAALRALSGRSVAAAHDALVRVATRALAPEQRGTQRGELLAWLALRGLPADQARPLIEQHRLQADDAPRLAELGFAHVTLPSDGSWLAPALDNPWPQVRQAALARVEGPCPSSNEKLLEQRAHLAGRRSEDDRAVARSAVAALGRCGAGDRLAGLLGDLDLDIELRAEAARQLARLGDDESIAAIASVLDAGTDRALARRLASALRHMPRATPAGDALLCEVATRSDEAGHAARESLRALHDDPSQACQ